MGFRKSTNETEVAVVVTHKWHPGDEFTFYFPKVLPQAAIEAEGRFLGLKEDAREEEYRQLLIETVAAMVTRDPIGFDDFPTSDAPLADRFIAYFDDPSQPELQSILLSVWREYRAGAIPFAYLKSIQRDGEGSRDVSRVPAQASP